MRIVLSTPPGKTTELWPPLGLLYIASGVRAGRGDDVKVIDAFCENLTAEELARRVVAAEPDVFGINCSTHTFLDAMGALEAISKALPDAKLVMGGFHATFAAEQILQKHPSVDYIIKGEAERSFPQLLDSIDGKIPLADVEGISYLDGGVYHSNKPARIDSLDELPFPDRSLVSEVEYGYSHQNIKLTFGKFTTLCTSRGCPYSCSYCSCAAFSQRRWRPRSAENVAAEIEALYRDGYESCVFVDDNFSLDPKRVFAICEKIKERRIKMDLCCEARVDGVSPELLRAMKGAGFNVIYFGAESACQHVLDYYNKTITPEKTRKGVEMAKRAGMIVISSFIFGAPVESSEDMRKTIQFIRDTKPHAIQINILDCLIGTPIWDDLVEKGIPKPDDWSRNHRIYEYNKGAMSRKELETMVNEGYAAYVGAWKSWQLVPELASLLIKNRVSRKVILGNVFNPDVRRRISEGMRKDAVQGLDSFEASPTAR
jgi:anaerobic magnesium-protoporphyrin IX monomethyl ester cyclase